MKKIFSLKILFLLLTCAAVSGARPTVIIKGALYRHGSVVARELGCGYYFSGKNYYFARGRENFSFRAERADFRA